jgi:hypothetical protein
MFCFKEVRKESIGFNCCWGSDHSGLEYYIKSRGERTLEIKIKINKNFGFLKRCSGYKKYSLVTKCGSANLQCTGINKCWSSGTLRALGRGRKQTFQKSYFFKMAPPPILVY